jgi:hypothetical protein
MFHGFFIIFGAENTIIGRQGPGFPSEDIPCAQSILEKEPKENFVLVLTT